MLINYYSYSDEIKELGKSTLMQAVVYDEIENFRSKKVLKKNW
jgi:hypothetical protein